MQSLLTTEQKTKLEQMKQERITKAKERNKRGMENMKAKLNLSDEQVNKLNASHESFAAKAKEIRSNQSLSSDQKKERFKALEEQRKEEAKSILTSEQLEKMQQLHKDRRNNTVK
jgi:Spy/CpxP family protein refolding chaperone